MAKKKPKDKLPSGFKGRKSLVKSMYNGDNSFRRNVRNIMLAGLVYTVFYTILSAWVDLMELDSFYAFGFIAWNWSIFLTTLTAVVVPTLIVLFLNEFRKEAKRKKQKRRKAESSRRKRNKK